MSNDRTIRAYRGMLAALLALVPTVPRTGATTPIPDIYVSSAPAQTPKQAPLTWQFHADQAAGPVDQASGHQKHATVGVSGGISEGKPLEMTLWSSGGAIAGSLAGPLGTIVGAGVGALCGFLVATFIVPHNGPEMSSSALQTKR